VLVATLRAFGVSHASTFGCAVGALITLRAGDDSAERYAVVLDALVAGLRAHAAVATVPMSAFILLGYLTTLSGGALGARLTAAGMPAAVARALRANAADARLQEAGVGALQKLCVTRPQTCKELLPSGAAAAAVAACRTHASSTRLQTECCKLLVLVRADDVTQLAALGILDAVSAALAAHPGDSTLIMCCASTLDHACASSAPNRARAVRAGALPALVAAMAARAADRKCVEYAAGALAAVCSKLDVHGCAVATAAGVQAAAAKALLHHAGGSAKVSTSCCAVLAGTCTTLQQRQLAAAASGFEAAAAALAAHPAAMVVQVYGTNAIGNICSADVQLKERGGAAGALEAVVAVLPRCLARTPHSAQLAQVATCALSNLTKEVEANSSRAFAAGALPALVAAMAAHVTDAAVVRFGTAALTNVISDSDKRRLAAGVDAVRALLAIMRAHPAAAPMQQTACAALAAVCKNVEAHAAAAAAAGALPLLVAAMVAHPRDAEVQHDACSALAVVCAHDTSRKTAAGATGAAGAAEAITAALRQPTCRGDAHVLGRLLYTFSLTGVPANAARAAAAGAAAATADAMRAHATSGSVVLCGCDTLLGLVKEHAPSVDAAVAAGAIEAVTSALLSDAFPDPAQRAMVHIAGVRLLQQLTQGREAYCAHAVRAGALQLRDDAAVENQNQTQVQAASLRQALLTTLHDAAAQHDRAAPGACAAAATGGGCRRCDEWRADGRLCALLGCGARRRAEADGNDAGRRLLRCAACRVVAYCSAEHQREDWRAGHKGACAALRAQRVAGGADAADNEAQQA
jgi:hypothetical protein